LNEEDFTMKAIVAVAVLNAALAIAAISGPAAAAAVPCEDMLKQMRDAKKSTQIADADMKKVNDLETRAVERCNADDDARSDKFLAEAMKIMGK
jgi:hypothetical protein